jgi:hypothetical protein
VTQIVDVRPLAGHLSQFRMCIEAQQNAETRFREAIAAMDVAVERWKDEPSDSNHHLAKVAMREAIERMAIFVAQADHAATLAEDGMLCSASDVARMWHVIADLLTAHSKALIYLTRLERTWLPLQSKDSLPLRPHQIESILARWPG